MKQKPARLGKPQQDAIFVVSGRYAHIIVPICIVILIILIAFLFIVFIDMATAHNSTMVMVESGNYYNHLQDVI